MFQPKRKLTNFDIKIKIQGHRIFPSNAVKYLGVLIDNNLSWNHHINHICSKLQRANGALGKLRHFVPRTVLLSLCYALFQSHMSYCCQVWGQHKKTSTSRVPTLQKTALIIITFSDFRSPSSPIFLSLKVLSLFDYVKLLNVILVHQIKNESLPIPVMKTFDLVTCF